MPPFSARTHFSQKHSVHCRPTFVMHQLVALRTLRIVKETAPKQTLMKRTDGIHKGSRAEAPNFQLTHGYVVRTKKLS